MKLLKLFYDKIAQLRNDSTFRKFLLTLIVIVSFIILVGILETKPDYVKAGEIYCFNSNMKFKHMLDETYCINQSQGKYQIMIICDPTIQHGKKCNVTRID